MATKRSIPKTHKANGKANGKVIDTALTIDLSNLKIINDCIVFDVCSGTFHRVSETAAFIIGELKRRTPVVMLVAGYMQRYKISQSIAERDVELFLNDISALG